MAADVYARIEGINLRQNSNSAAPYGGRKRYLRVVFTPAFTEWHVARNSRLRRTHRLARKRTGIACSHDCFEYIKLCIRPSLCPPRARGSSDEGNPSPQCKSSVKFAPARQRASPWHSTQSQFCYPVRQRHSTSGRRRQRLHDQRQTITTANPYSAGQVTADYQTLTTTSTAAGIDLLRPSPSQRFNASKTYFSTQTRQSWSLAARLHKIPTRYPA